jgi:hypothetical protein
MLEVIIGYGATLDRKGTDVQHDNILQCNKKLLRTSLKARWQMLNNANKKTKKAMAVGTHSSLLFRDPSKRMQPIVSLKRFPENGLEPTD